MLVVTIRGHSEPAARMAKPEKIPSTRRTPWSSFDTVNVETPTRPSSVTAIINEKLLEQYKIIAQFTGNKKRSIEESHSLDVVVHLC